MTDWWEDTPKRDYKSYLTRTVDITKQIGIVIILLTIVVIAASVGIYKLLVNLSKS